MSKKHSTHFRAVIARPSIIDFTTVDLEVEHMAEAIWPNNTLVKNCALLLDSPDASFNKFDVHGFSIDIHVRLTIGDEVIVWQPLERCGDVIRAIAQPVFQTMKRRVHIDGGFIIFEVDGNLRSILGQSILSRRDFNASNMSFNVASEVIESSASATISRLLNNPTFDPSMCSKDDDTDTIFKTILMKIIDRCRDTGALRTMLEQSQYNPNALMRHVVQRRRPRRHLDYKFLHSVAIVALSKYRPILPQIMKILLGCPKTDIGTLRLPGDAIVMGGNMKSILDHSSFNIHNIRFDDQWHLVNVEHPAFT